MSIEAMRAYDFKDRKKTGDEYVILVDRLWPRGVKKNQLQPDEWARDIAPSAELRRWFAHDKDKWVEFKKAYRKELKDHRQTLERIRRIAREKKVILLYGAKETTYNHAQFLAQELSK